MAPPSAIAVAETVRLASLVENPRGAESPLAREKRVLTRTEREQLAAEFVAELTASSSEYELLEAWQHDGRIERFDWSGCICL